MTALLLDTSVLLELLAVPEASFVPDRVFDEMNGADRVVLSATSFYEVNQKTRIGKLTTDYLGEATILELQREGIDILPLSPVTMARAAALRWRHRGRDHRDPFDRMIAATAIDEKLTVVSADTAFDALGVARFWT